MGIVYESFIDPTLGRAQMGVKYDWVGFNEMSTILKKYARLFSLIDFITIL